MSNFSSVLTAARTRLIITWPVQRVSKENKLKTCLHRNCILGACFLAKLKDVFIFDDKNKKVMVKDLVVRGIASKEEVTTSVRNQCMTWKSMSIIFTSNIFCRFANAGSTEETSTTVFANRIWDKPSFKDSKQSNLQWRDHIKLKL